MDGIELAIYAGAAVLLLGLLVVLGVRASYRLGGSVGSGLASAGVLAVMALAIRDRVRRRWSVASVAVVAAYGLCLAAVIVADAIG